MMQVTAATFGQEGLGHTLPVLVMDESVVAFLQGTVLLTSISGSLLLQQRLQARSYRLYVPQTFIMFVLFIEAWHLIMA